MDTFKMLTVHGGEYDFPFVEDNGFGELYAIFDSLGLTAVVRAESEDKAYQCWVDEIAPDPVDDDIWQDGPDGPELIEGYEYRASGIPSNPKLKSQIASIDLNGVRVSPLLHVVIHGGHWNVPAKTVWKI
jgi:hypothetical protein